MTAPPPTASTVTGVPPDRLASLRRWNLALTALHLVQAVAVIALASDFAITGHVVVPRRSSRLGGAATRGAVRRADRCDDRGVPRARRRGPPGNRDGRSRHLRARPAGRDQPVRWVEYSFSASIMIVLICLYSGILYELRPQPVVAVPRHRAVAERRLRREGLPRPQPRGEVRPGLADLRRLAGDLTAPGPARRWPRRLPVGTDPSAGAHMRAAVPGERPPVMR